MSTKKVITLTLDDSIDNQDILDCLKNADIPAELADVCWSEDDLTELGCGDSGLDKNDPDTVIHDSDPSGEEGAQESAAVEKTDSNGLDSSKESRVSPQMLGQRGEQAAGSFLQKQGYEIIHRNWKCPAGEVDIIAKDGDCLVFVEVKTRKGLQAGLPEEAVDKAKRSRYERIAAFYLAQSEYKDIPVRFDVVGIQVLSDKRAFLRHHRNAFGFC